MEKLSELSNKVLDQSRKVVKEKYEIPIAIAGAVAIILTIRAVKKSKKDSNTRTDFSNSLTGTMNLLGNKDSVLQRDEVKDAIQGYEDLFAGARKNVGTITDKVSIKKRETEYQSMVNSFYNLVTDFYEWGWGQSFHFAPRWKGESFIESIKRAEFYLAMRMQLTPGMHVLDMGCGVGGPMRNICRFADVKITGITINQYQVNVVNKYNKQMHLDHLCHAVQGDFQNLPFEDDTFHALYAIEATCHSPDRVRCFQEAYRVMRKGAYLVTYDWVVTDNYDPTNADHVRIKEGIEVGNGLPTLVTGPEVDQTLQDAGFEVVDSFDAQRGVHDPDQIPWYNTLEGNFSPSGFRMTRFGRNMTHAMVCMLEMLKIAPKGSGQVSTLLNATALDLVEGGKLAIFTPSYFVLARKN